MTNQSQLAPQPSASGSAEAALVQSSPPDVHEGAQSVNALFFRLPVEIEVAVPVRKFRVRDLLTLAKGVVIGSQWVQGDDLPLAAPGAQLAWTEFEVIDQRLAVRITRLV